MCRSWAVPWRFAPAHFCASPPLICCRNCNSILHDRFKLSIALLIGLTVAIVIKQFEAG